MTRKTFLILTMLLLAATVTGCLAPWREANEYARQFEVSLGEAVQRLRYQDQIGELAEDLATSEPDTYAGLWIEHEPTYRIVVRFTQDPEGTIRPHIEGLPFARLVEARGARYTTAELEEIHAMTVAQLGKLDFDVSSSVSVQQNRVEVYVSDRAWVESELRRAGAALPEGAVWVVVQGGSTARGKESLLTPPVPGIAFPRQQPVEGERASMAAELVGTLYVEGDCLYVDALQGGERVLPIWPPEFTLRVEDGQVLVIDGAGEIAAHAGEEVYMGGGHVSVSDEWVLGQIPEACRGSYFVVGSEVRPNLRQDTELLSTETVATEGGTVLFLRHSPALGERVAGARSISGKLVAYEYYRCLHLQTESFGPFTLLWPPEWSLQVADGAPVVRDEKGTPVARLGDEVLLRARSVPHSWDDPSYRQLVGELPGDCISTTWLVDGVEARP